jgi:putative ABC transport system substrate-binding protein
MDNTMTKFAKVIALVLTLMMVFSTACAAEKLTIGIAQFAEHPSLDNCREGFIAGMAEAGYTEENVEYVVMNAQADMGLAQQIAQQMSAECDLICAIATPMAQAAVNACIDNGKPVIYTAVSDPVAAMLANDEGKSSLNTTGSCDLLPVEAQLKLIRAILPEAKNIGILYTTSETNSESQLKLYKDLAPAYGFEIVEAGVSMGADVPLAMDNILPKVDCISNLTDNTVVSYLAVMIDKANTAGKPI